MHRAALLVFFVVALVSGPARAAKVKVWHQHAPRHFDQAQLKQTVVSSEGALRLSRHLKPLADLHVTHIWDMVEDKDGNLLVATGDEGKIYRVTPEGKVSVAFDSQESQILCLAAAADGAVYAGTGPSGLVIRLAPNGKAKVIYHSPENYVWALALDSKGETIYAGTGPKGRIYQITPKGKASVFYTTKQEHVLCLAPAPDGALYAGTDKNGLIYRIDPKGKGFVLYQAPQPEVRSLLVTPEGIFAGTSSPGRRKSANAGGDRVSSAAPPAVLASILKASRTVAKSAKETPKEMPDDLDKEPEKDKPAAAATPPGTGENSLYRLGADGTVREIFRDKLLILSLLRQRGKILVGTGMEGRLFEIDETTREHSEIARLDHGQVHCLYKRKDGPIVIGTGDPGKLYVLEEHHAASGTVVSQVHDAKIVSKWGSLRWKAETPPGTAITLSTRGGNVAEPDETWSDWSAEQTDAEQARIVAPPARFLQYRVTMTSDKPEATPILRDVALRYATTNQAPEVGPIDVPDLDAGKLKAPKKLKFKWTATDANEDDLTYHLWIRKDGWDSWVRIEDDLSKTEYEWDTTTTPAGTYRLKVVASDRKDNPTAEALTGERISAPFAVAHAPPTVTVKVAGVESGQATIEATATDPLVRLTSAQFAVSGKKWTHVFPADGLFDDKTESFQFKTAALKPGTYVLVLKVCDAAGNVGSGDVVFVVPGK